MGLIEEEGGANIKVRKVIHMVAYLSVVELIMELRKMHLFLGKIICII